MNQLLTVGRKALVAGVGTYVSAELTAFAVAFQGGLSIQEATTALVVGVPVALLTAKKVWDTSNLPGVPGLPGIVLPNPKG